MAFCLVVLCVALALSFGVMQLETGKLTVAVTLESFSSLTQAGVRGAVAVAVAFVFALTIAWCSIMMASIALILSMAIVSVVYVFATHADADPSLYAVVSTLLGIYIAYLFCRLIRRQVQHRKVSHFFSNHVPSNLTEYYLENPSSMEAVSESRELTILFCDIKRFTSTSETLEPSILSDWLNAYFGIVTKVIHQYGGTVDKYMGDSVMAFWGAPRASDTHAIDALHASREIQREVAALSRDMQRRNMPPIMIGIGISTGFANVGHMGSRYHMTYTAVGDPVNIANRLQRCTGYYDLAVVVSESTVQKAPDYQFRELDTVHVKGRQRLVRLFEPVSPIAEAVPEELKRLQLHRKAMQFYRRGMWGDARNLFERLAEEDPKFYQRYIQRIEKIQTTRPSDQSAHILDLTRQLG